MPEGRLSPLMVEALGFLLAYGCDDSYIHGGHEVLVESGQAAIGFRTAHALAKRGLVTVNYDPFDDYGFIALTPQGRMRAVRLHPRQTPATCLVCRQRTSREAS